MDQAENQTTTWKTRFSEVNRVESSLGKSEKTRNISFRGQGGQLSGSMPYSALDQPLSKVRTEVSLSAFAFLFAATIQYAQHHERSVQGMEQFLSHLGARFGLRALEMTMFRERSGTSSSLKRETRLIGMLYFLQTVFWKTMFGKPADSLERSTEREEEYMIGDNDPLINRFISVPRELHPLNCGAFVAGILQSILCACHFPATVSAHSVPTEARPTRTVYLIQLERSVLNRERWLDVQQQQPSQQQRSSHRTDTRRSGTK